MERRLTNREIHAEHQRLKLAVETTPPTYKPGNPDDLDDPYRGYDPVRKLQDFEQRYGIY